MTRLLGSVFALLFWFAGVAPGTGGVTASWLFGWIVALATFKGLSFGVIIGMTSVLIPSEMVMLLLI